MDSLQIYADYVRPVVEAIREHHNEFHRLEYLSVKPEDLHVIDGKIVFDRFVGDLSLVRVTRDGATGSCILQIEPKHRDFISAEVVQILVGENLEKWEKTANKIVWIPLDATRVPPLGYMLSDDIEEIEYIGYALDFLSQRLGLTYLFLNNGNTDLEYILG